MSGARGSEKPLEKTTFYTEADALHSWWHTRRSLGQPSECHLKPALQDRGVGRRRWGLMPPDVRALQRGHNAGGILPYVFVTTCIVAWRDDDIAGSPGLDVDAV